MTFNLQTILRTEQLHVRHAGAEDAGFIHRLWTSPAVMRFLGYPEGLAISIEAVRRQLVDGPDSAFGSRLIVERSTDGLAIGQGKLGAPDVEGISEPDIKLDPAHWGRGYGTELWRALIDYAFRHSEARIVQGTPNRENVASVRMQMGAGMIWVGEGVFTEHLGSHPGTVPVPFVRLQITREDWKSRSMDKG